MNNFSYDCIYYYHCKKWHKGVLVSKFLGGVDSLDELKKSVEKMGYIAVYGNSSIGPPIGPPTK